MSDPTPNLFHYRATFLEAHDGDTITVDIDMGMGISVRSRHIRLFGINTPELMGATKTAAEGARDALKAMIASAKDMIIETVMDKDEKYGRLLGKIWLKQADGTWLLANDEMIKRGLAKPYFGVGAKS